MLNGVSGGKVVVRGRGGSLRLIRDEKLLVEGERKGSELREGKFCYQVQGGQQPCGVSQVMG